MRVGIAYLIQETNSFSPISTRLEDFRILTGSSALEKWSGTKTELGAFIDFLSDSRIEAVPLFAGWAITQGPIEEDDFARLKGMIAVELERAGRLNGLLLALHGAMCAEGTDDCEGAILELIRRTAGHDLPIVLTLDLHANVTRRIVQWANAVIGYKTYPHVDFYRCGWMGAEMLNRTIQGEISPVAVMTKLPLIVPAENMQTTAGPMADVLALGKSFRRQHPEILDVSAFGVQPWLDIEEMGCATLTVADRNRPLADQCCREMAKKFWDERHRFDVTLLSPAEAIQMALATEGQPVVLSESSDSPTAGSPGDSAEMLKALLDHAPGTSAAIWVRDPAAVERTWGLAPGTPVQLEVGAGFDKINRFPVRIRAVFRSSSEGQFVPGGTVYQGMHFEMGRTSVLEIGAISLLVSEKAVPVVNPELYRSQGVEPKDKKIVIVKSPANFRAEYAPLAVKMILVDTPGVSSANIRKLPYRRVPRPLYPLDEMEFMT
jgi:microcystin degradation protein MlrC